jgi:hypothetical protein
MTGTNNANFGGFLAGLTPVGFFAGSPSAYGTYDQIGNVRQWNEAIINPFGGFVYRGLRGGSLADSENNGASTFRYYDYPAAGGYNSGFRIVNVPEPQALTLLLLGLGAILGLACRRCCVRSLNCATENVSGTDLLMMK